MLDAAYYCTCSVVCVFVCLGHNCEPIEYHPFMVWTLVGLKNCVLGGIRIPRVWS